MLKINDVEFRIQRGGIDDSNTPLKTKNVSDTGVTTLQPIRDDKRTLKLAYTGLYDAEYQKYVNAIIKGGANTVVLDGVTRYMSLETMSQNIVFVTATQSMWDFSFTMEEL